MAAHTQNWDIQHDILLELNVEQIESGLPLERLTAFVEASSVPLKDIYLIVIAARTLKLRRDKRQSLTRDESDRLVRLMRVYDHAVRVFGKPEMALRWLSNAKERFRGKTPLDMLQTEFGGQKVEEMLWQIADGIFV